jgi:hypothetical protein
MLKQLPEGALDADIHKIHHAQARCVHGLKKAAQHQLGQMLRW